MNRDDIVRITKPFRVGLTVIPARDPGVVRSINGKLAYVQFRSCLDVVVVASENLELRR